LSIAERSKLTGCFGTDVGAEAVSADGDDWPRHRPLVSIRNAAKDRKVMRSPERAEEGEIGKIRINRAFNGTKCIAVEVLPVQLCRAQKKAQAAAWALPVQCQVF
jgi:hypothetical protein